MLRSLSNAREDGISLIAHSVGVEYLSKWYLMVLRVTGN